MNNVHEPARSKSMGLSEKEAQRLLRTYGPNEIVARKKISAIIDFLVRFKNPLVLILVVAAIISAFSDDLISAAIIIAMVVISVILDFVNTYKSQKAAEALKKKVTVTATTLRDGVEVEIPLSQIVPTDIVRLSPGDFIPADGKLLEAKDFFLNESSLTGESFPVEKQENNAVFMGTSVISGGALMEVEQTGSKTKLSAIAASIAQEELPSEFDRGTQDFSVLIMKATFFLVLFVFLVNALTKHDILESFLFASALAVGLTPELLPMIIAINLSKGSLAMSKHGVIVKKLNAIESLGNMDILCTDKTGTLTEDKISLIKYVDGLGNKSENVLHHAYINSALETEFKNPLSSAIKGFENIDISDVRKIDEIPFDYIHKRNSIIVERAKKRLLISKGAPEELLVSCRKYDGHPLLQEVLKKINQQYEQLSREGFRVLGVAIKNIREEKKVYSHADEQNMEFLGFMAFLDPPKQSAAQTIRMLEQHGVEIKIITGDNGLVAGKIAHDIGLVVRGNMTGVEVDAASDSVLEKKVKNTTIFSRVSPNQKMRIINLIQKTGAVVGYMGDGINDAPSLKAADVGISVNNAVDVAKESADLILLHKNLQDLISGIVEGRKIFANTLKYLMITLSSNFGNMFSMAGASIFIPFLPMLPVQILLNNLLYDTTQFAISLDNVDAQDVQKPRRWNMSFIRKFMVTFGPLSSLFDFITFGALIVVFKFAAPQFQTAWFLESIATQTLAIYIIRTKQIPFIQSQPSRALVASTIAGVTLAVIIVFTKTGSLFRLTPLPWTAIVAITLIVAAYLLTLQWAKQLFYKRIQI